MLLFVQLVSWPSKWHKNPHCLDGTLMPSAKFLMVFRELRLLIHRFAKTAHIICNILSWCRVPNYFLASAFNKWISQERFCRHIIWERCIAKSVIEGLDSVFHIDMFILLWNRLPSLFPEGNLNSPSQWLLGDLGEASKWSFSSDGVGFTMYSIMSTESGLAFFPRVALLYSRAYLCCLVETTEFCIQI